MAIVFPTSPVLTPTPTTFTNAGVTYTWDGTKWSVGLSTPLDITSTQTITGAKTFSNFNYTGSLTGTTVINENIELNVNGTGDRYSYIDFHSDNTYTDFSLRLIRYNTGLNAASELSHRGTGNLNFKTIEAAVIAFFTTGLERLRITAAGNVGIGTTAPANPLTVAGVIESTTGGIKFPDGTTQVSAVIAAPSVNYATILKFQ
jgi:hypothetical protein